MDKIKPTATDNLSSELRACVMEKSELLSSDKF